jgi:hypothetical protein
MPYIPDLKQPGLGALEAVMDEPYHEYWFHLGRFIHAFTQAEVQLLFLLRSLSGLNIKNAGVIFHATRVEQATALIKNILYVSDQAETKEHLKRPLEQLSVIATIRNNILHWGAKAEIDGSFRISNKKYHPIKPKDFTVNVPDLNNLHKDVRNIFLILWHETHGPAEDDRFYRKLALAPWQYKPPQPIPPAKR